MKRAEHARRALPSTERVNERLYIKHESLRLKRAESSGQLSQSSRLEAAG
jgi:hypothetical protein